MIFKVSKSLILPCICIFIELIILKSKNKKYYKMDVVTKWLVFWSLGVGGIVAGLMQSINPSYTANFLDVVVNDMIIIKELGYANFSMGLLAILSVKYSNYRKPAALVMGMFLLGCTVNHFTRLEIINFEEMVSTFDNIWTIIVAGMVLVYQPKSKRDCCKMTDF
jgi:hypothetical protein